MIGVADQYCLRRYHAGPDNLADDTVRVDDGLAVVDTVATAYVNNEVVFVGIRVDRHDLGNANLVPNRLAGVEQRAQASVLGFERGQALESGVRQQPLGLQAPQFKFEFIARGRGIAEPSPEAHRRVDDELERVDSHANALANAVEMVLAMIEVHQHDADENKHEGPQTQRRDAGWVRVMSPGRGHGDVLGLSLQSEYSWAVLVDELDDPSAAPGDAGQRVVGDDDRQSGFLHQEFVEVA